MIPLTPTALAEAAANLYDGTLGGGLADLRRMPSTVIDEGPQRTVRRYHRLEGTTRKRAPVLLVPPLAAPAICFDLRRGCSVAQHLLQGGRPTYLVDYGEIEYADRGLGLEHWIEEVVPKAIRAASEDAGGRPVQVVGWCLGGILALLALAHDPTLPVSSVALIASPFDFAKVPLVAPLRPIAAITQGWGITQLYRLLGGAPAPLVKRGYQAAGFDKYLMKPWTVLSNLHDRELLAQIEAVDAFMDRMHAYPGRTFGQLYHRFFRTNDLADGKLALEDGTIDLGVVKAAGAGDRRPRRRDRARRGVPSRRGAAPARGRRARHRAGRSPRRADRPRGGRDDVDAARRLPRQACTAPCKARQTAGWRWLSGYPERPMRLPVLLSALALLLVLAAPAGAQEPRIAPGTKAGNLDVGGLTVQEAVVKLQQSYNASLGRPLSIQVAGRRYRLTIKKAKLAFDAPLTARRALRQPAANVPLAITWDQKVVQKLSDRVAKAVYLAPRNAEIRITLRHIFRTSSRTGRSLSATTVRTMIEQTLANPDPASSRIVRPARKILKARITADKLARAYPTVITIDRNNFKLRLFKRLKFSKSYGVAVGQSAYPTPTGRFSITNKQVNPAWTAPNSPWAGELAGTTTPGGSAANPLRARWMGIVNGVGIHGTSQEYSIGSRASHGCIRMRVADVIDLYPRVPVGTPVLIR